MSAPPDKPLPTAARLAGMVKALDQAKDLLGAAWKLSSEDLEPMRAELMRIGRAIAAQAEDVRAALRAAQTRPKNNP